MVYKEEFGLDILFADDTAKSNNYKNKPANLDLEKAKNYKFDLSSEKYIANLSPVIKQSFKQNKEKEIDWNNKSSNDSE